MQDRTTLVVGEMLTLAFGDGELASAHGPDRGRSGPTGQHVQGCTDVSQERVVGMTRGGLLQLEQCRPVGVGVDGGRWHEVAEDADPVGVLNRQPCALDQRCDAGCVKAPGQGIGRSPSTIVAGESALSLGELASEGSGEHSRDPGGDHEADVATIGEHGCDGPHRRGGVIDELEGAVAAHKVGVGIGVDLEQIGGVALNGHDPIGDPRVTRSTRQRRQRVRAGVDDSDVVTKLGQRNGKTTRATTKIDDAQSMTESLLAFGHDGPHRLPDG